MVTCYIKENSVLARIAAWQLKSKQVAMVIGRTIHLHNTPAQVFLKNTKWVRHEVKHVQQYQQLGVVVFLLKYIWLSVRYGYYNNPFEKEARAAETITGLENQVLFKV
jgi:hypothetical protein